MLIDRYNPIDARNIVDQLIPDPSLQQSILSFLSEAVNLAKKINEDNWNINLDKNGRFVRFNVGQEYCIELEKKGLLILTKRECLPKEVTGKQFNIQFRGYIDRKPVIMDDCEKVPDILAKVPGSLGCFVPYEQAELVMPKLKRANHQFLTEAITTTNILPKMKHAHSPGFVALLQQSNNPTFTEENFYQNEQEKEQKVSTLSEKDLLIKIAEQNYLTQPQRVQITAHRYQRNALITAYVKKRANGICEDCKEPAPFVNKTTNEPFLEIHHIIPLSAGGADNPENTIALCPNCHRKRHYG